jgi:hypothetical protein
MNEAIDAIGQHQVFGDIVDLLEGRKALPSHWVYRSRAMEQAMCRSSRPG